MSPRSANDPSAPTPEPRPVDSHSSAVGATARGIALTALLLLAALFAVSHMDQGIDTWISLAGGRDVMAQGVRDADPFSFQSRQPHPAAAGLAARVGHWLQPHGWINQNWLTHSLLFLLVRAGGLDALVAWKLVNYLLVGVVLIAAGRVLGAAWTWSVLSACAALVTSRSYLSIRAQDITNLMIALFVLVVALAERRHRRWAWALVPLFVVWANAHGGYIYGFILVAALAVPDWLQARRSGPLVGEERRRLIGLLAPATAALVASVALSPYRLANLTHPLVISVSADAAQWRVVREWRPLFTNPVASPVPFVVLAVITAAVLVLYARRAARPVPDRVTGLGLRIGIVSFALAVTSGRFVPIASIAAAPFLAFWLHGVAAAVARRVGLDAAERRRTVVIAAAALLWVAVAAGAAAFVPRALRTYAGPWPQDARRAGLFDRMTFSHQRPWGPCEFLTANGVTGRMWNFWGEGGFLAYCQPPDAATGRVPVGLFIDGRAQAAYDVAALESYLDLLNGTGGTATREAAPASPVAATTPADLTALRTWTAGRLRELGVWVAVVPASQQSTAFARAAVGLPGWKLIYVDPEHTVFADTENPAGRSLSERVAAGSARFPDTASAKLTAAFRLLPPTSEEDQQRAVGLARESYLAAPSTLAVLCAGRVARAPAAHGQAVAFFNELVDEFTTHRDRHRASNGYAQRLDAAAMALSYLAAEADRAQQPETRRRVAALLGSCRAEQERIVAEALW
jgi:hypothetical protein